MLCDEHREKVTQDGRQKQSIDEKRSIYDFMKNLYHPWNLSIAQMFLMMVKVSLDY